MYQNPDGRIKYFSEVDDFIRKLRLKFMFRDTDRAIPELHRNTGYDPGMSTSPTLERLIEKLRNTLFLVINKLSRPKNNLSPRLLKALLNLQRKKDLVIRKADKGSVIVIENLHDYVRNRREHLSDAKVYRRLRKDICLPIRQAVTLRLNRLYEAGKLSEEQFKYCLPPPRVRPGRMYFLNKIHKRPHHELFHNQRLVKL